MCTVSYIPTKSGFLLTSSRDENPQRGTALLPQKYELHGNSIFCPKDPLSGGTWLLTSDHYTLCLLNGAFKAHDKKNKYRHSRGQILLDFFKYKSALAFIEEYNLSDIEPFSLLILQKNSSKIHFDLLRWDGNKKHVEKLDPSISHLFSSATLYSDTVKEERKQWLAAYLRVQKRISQHKMFDFHLNTNLQDRNNGLRIHRSETLQTVSICSLDCNPQRTKIIYQDLINDKKYQYRILHLKLDPSTT